MKTKEQKKQSVAALQDKLGRAVISIFTSFTRQGDPTGLNVASSRTLRNSLRAIQAEYVVEKKTLLTRVLRNVPAGTDAVAHLEGSIGAVFGYGDEVEVARTVYQFSKKQPAVHLLGALFQGTYLDAAQFTALAKLPGREALVAQLVQMLAYPLTGLVRVFAGVPRNFVVVLDQIAKQKTV